MPIIGMKTATQSRDERTGKTGSFGYKDNKPLWSVTPVFANLTTLYQYARNHNMYTMIP